MLQLPSSIKIKTGPQVSSHKLMMILPHLPIKTTILEIQENLILRKKPQMIHQEIFIKELV